MSSVPDSAPSFLEHPELPPGVDPPRSRRPAWRAWTAWAALVAGIAGAIFGSLIVLVVATLFGADYDDPPAVVNLLGTVVQDVLLVGVAMLFARLAGRPRPGDFGLRSARFGPALGWTVLAMVAFYVFTAAWVSLVGADPNDDQVTQQLGVEESTAALIAAAALVTVMAPIAEEIFFRGYFFGALRNWRGVWPAAVITGLVFGSIHAGSADVAYLLPLAFFGFALCLVYERTGSLYPCIALHCVNNSIAFGVMQDWTWEIAVLMVSALAVIALLALAVRRWWSPRPPALAARTS